MLRLNNSRKGKKMNKKIQKVIQTVTCAGALVMAATGAQASMVYLDADQKIAIFSNNVYQYVTSPQYWPNALSAAGTYSYNGQIGHLLTVTSLAENSFIYSAFVGPRYATPGANVEQATPWLALSDQADEGVWRWQAGPELGSVASFTNWNYGEPNNLGDEDFAVLHWQDRGLGTGKWYDYGPLGYNGQTFVVEFENAAIENPTPIPVPGALLLMAPAVLCLGRRRRRPA